MSATANPFNLKKQLAFYGAYHTNPVNVGIHIIGVPSIIFATSALLAKQGSILPLIQEHSPLLAAYLSQLGSILSSLLPSSIFQYAQLNLSALFMGSYWLYYSILDTTAAFMLAPIWYGLWYGSTFLARTRPDATKIAIGIKALGWISQFYGHGVHERRAPALLDNLLGAVVLAPFFVFLEVIFHFGYRRELQKELKNEVGILVTKFRTQKGKAKRGKAN
ncbi:hypothetical protein NDA11_007311 [Ustilago hordei]|uniref:DUF962 domain protein n=1 Tax=Ustilago hordei TaxID=120017 RepID=I2FXV3_USTHO|nr:uncharacterized protein UHO2_00219 [Ustilago hordei]KAJ1041223.1 hypothetical protein NDA10_007361 [Ustilago hordei]KAJ1571053.1 hypothetical protein NDA11_007311 [Ustilago hordei]KAJ1587592.1 hypothetical protein NDA15_006874 [Ustilago hordei]KAJ1589920.1 hypothetical protein NDA12_002194 [Ustilago hordei]KAJ1602359.1 hypothetical protein NDA14_004498 [Ustilago hordei]